MKHNKLLYALAAFFVAAFGINNANAQFLTVNTGAIVAQQIMNPIQAVLNQYYPPSTWSTASLVESIGETTFMGLQNGQPYGSGDKGSIGVVVEYGGTSIGVGVEWHWKLDDEGKLYCDIKHTMPFSTQTHVATTRYNIHMLNGSITVDRTGLPAGPPRAGSFRGQAGTWRSTSIFTTTASWNPATLTYRLHGTYHTVTYFIPTPANWRHD